MKLKKIVPTLIIGGSMALLAQSALAATSPAVFPEKQPEAQVKSIAAPGDIWMWSKLYDLYRGESRSTWPDGVYESPYPHRAKLFIHQQATNLNEEDPIIRYSILKANYSGSYSSITVDGRKSETHSVDLDRGTYFIIADNIGRSTADAYVHLSNSQ
ncbi:hypothetical protein [Paenibacillus elgii]|uniref:hypothetical protein n=1 Tax=Paenibacillus elgii TaxID=189691 RepID=UPI00203ACC5A|nr:hypothetical protein [Paenibacillus elgii]MCM3274204.1 hypothetical protein [Paenibacillus elgii]